MRDVLEIIYVSALFAVVLMPVLRGIMKLRIGKWKPGRGSAIFILLLGVAGAASLFFFVALPPVIRDMREFAAEAPTRVPQLLDRIHRLPLSSHVDTAALNAKLQDFASNAASYLLLSIKTWATKLFDVITGIILTIYFLLEGEIAYYWVLSFLPVDKRQRLDSTLARAEVRMGKWLLGQGSLMLVLGLTSMIVFLFLHVRYAYALGVIMGLFNLIPIAGAVVSMSLVVLVAAIDSWGRVAGVLIFYAIYAQVETSFPDAADHEAKRGSGRPGSDHRSVAGWSARGNSRRHGGGADGGPGCRTAQRICGQTGADHRRSQATFHN